jgi:hypothetical protein
MTDCLWPLDKRALKIFPRWKMSLRKNRVTLSFWCDNACSLRRQWHKTHERSLHSPLRIVLALGLDHPLFILPITFCYSTVSPERMAFTGTAEPCDPGGMARPSLAFHILSLFIREIREMPQPFCSWQFLRTGSTQETAVIQWMSHEQIAFSQTQVIFPVRKTTPKFIKPYRLHYLVLITTFLYKFPAITCEFGLINYIWKGTLNSWVEPWKFVLCSAS